MSPALLRKDFGSSTGDILSFILPSFSFFGGAYPLPREHVRLKREGGSPEGANAASGAVASRDGYEEGKVT